jgi:uncharacterized protein (UPF0332 family)
MDEYQFAEETVARMRSLFDLAGNHEVVRRTILSRVYYSAHHLSRYLLRNVGLRPETWRRNVHRRVIDEMRQRFVNTGLMNRERCAFLEDLRRFRVRADYQLHLTIDAGHVENMFNRFDAYLDECRHLLEVVA